MTRAPQKSRDPISQHAAITAARFAGGRGDICASSACAACVSADWRCAERFRELRSRPGKKFAVGSFAKSFSDTGCRWFSAEAERTGG